MALNRVSLVGLILAAAGCMTVRSIEPAEYIPKHNPPVVWVTRTNSSVVPVAAPVIKGDTIDGVWRGQRMRVAIPLGDIRTVRAKVHDRYRTVLFVTAATAVFASALYFGMTPD